MSKSHTPDWPGFRRELDGHGPVTSYDSQTVMLAAERDDIISITETVKHLDTYYETPEEVTVLKRTETYYGPELLVHAIVEGHDRNYLLTAPGPSSHLCLWAGEINEVTSKRTNWYPAAEVSAVLDTEQPPFESCDQCGELIRTIYHERESILGQCSRA